MMTFEELLEKFRNIKCEETRAHQDHYCEVVVSTATLPSAVSILQSYFGSPLKPAGTKPSKEAESHANPYGGVMGNQTLYFHQSETTRELALLWPWENGTSVTLKIIRKS